MALDFLGALGGATQAAGSIGGLVSSLGGLFGKKQKVPGEAQNALALQYDMMRGLAGQGSPAYDNLVAQERNQSKTALLKAINEIIRQNRRSMTRGPVGLLTSPDRRDEAISRALMGVYENENDRARASAKQAALGILGQAGGVAKGQIEAANMNYTGNRNAAIDRVLGFDQIANLGKKGIPEIGQFFSGLGAGAPSTTINDPAIIQQRRALSSGLY